jgi:hypothetical protein
VPGRERDIAFSVTAGGERVKRANGGKILKISFYARKFKIGK